ncbi:hypothetical protein KYG33_18595 [Chryseobacterium sp. D764]|uniref:hypothetical protein n=1 Tax=Chryseobacterium sp. D764 TaxID=2856522 RepID=UPI001C58FCD4|nr:hypothetical protein [Chryseobacterium sp. D764]QXU48769.1 hypothetical protein KYG33_18595 [Chryseobacterium sp. D764]
MSNYISLFNLKLIFDYEVFSLGQEYPYLLDCIEHEWRRDNSLDLKKVVGNIIIRHDYNISYKYFNPNYFSKLIELNKIQGNKAYLNYIKIINIMGYCIVITVKETTSKLKLDKPSKALFQSKIGQVISNFHFYKSKQNTRK